MQGSGKGITALVALLAFCPVSPVSASETARPNFVFIVADDMGYADCGVHGCKDIPTPHLDALAASGVRFTDGYVTGPVCSPTRAALMTGRYQARDGVSDWVKEGGRGMNTEVPTVASYLRHAGYRTALIGKWHLGTADSEHPMERGFDEFYGFLGGGRSYYMGPNEGKGEGAQAGTQILRGREPAERGDYLTYEFGHEARSFIRRQEKSGQPFFLVLSFNAVHTPLMGPRETPDTFASMEDANRRTYAGMMWAMDKAIGGVLEELRGAGFVENTFVAFISDNGGPITRNSPNASRNYPLRGGKGELWEGGIRVPFFVSWPGTLTQGTTFALPATQMDLTATALALAGVTPDPAWPIDGVNLMPHLAGGRADPPHATLCWAYENRQWAVREGKWKLVAHGANPRAPATPELFDLQSDIGESRDLATGHAEVVKDLLAKLEGWCREIELDPPKHHEAVSAK